MKLKKVLAATLAGTMVMASAATVFASETIVGDGWWGDGTCAVNEVSDDYYITGDGTWNIAIATQAYGGTTDEGYDSDWTTPPAFVVELYVPEELDYYYTSTCFGDMWEYGSMTFESTSGDTDGTSSWSTATGDVWAIEVTRDGQDFYMTYYLNGNIVIKQSMLGTNMPDTCALHILAETGAITYEVTTDGTVPEIEAITEDWDYATWLAEQTGTTTSTDTEADSEDADSEAADSEDADSEAAESDDAATTSDSSSDTAEESDGLSTGAIAAIVIVVIVVIAVIVLVAKNKNK